MTPAGVAVLQQRKLGAPSMWSSCATLIWCLPHGGAINPDSCSTKAETSSTCGLIPRIRDYKQHAGEKSSER